MRRVNLLFVILMASILSVCHVNAHDLSGVVGKVKPSVVGIGTFQPTASPRAVLQGTGFVIGDGTYIVTNYHVVDFELDVENLQRRVIFAGKGDDAKLLPFDIVEVDPLHDLAILKITPQLPALKLAPESVLPDGKYVAFTGFPLGGVLGVHAATHTGIIANYSPIVRPSSNASELSIEMMKRLREPFHIYQLDATAYPGNSGSAVYDPDSGQVVAIINKVFVKATKESAITDPSGITYAIPVQYIRELAIKAKIKL